MICKIGTVDEDVVDKERKLRDVVERQGSLDDPETWSTPDSQVFSLDDDDDDELVVPRGQRGRPGDDGFYEEPTLVRSVHDGSEGDAGRLRDGDGAGVPREEENTPDPEAGALTIVPPDYAAAAGEVDFSGGKTLSYGSAAEAMASGGEEETLDELLVGGEGTDLARREPNPASMPREEYPGYQGAQRLKLRRVGRVSPDSRLLMMTRPNCAAAEQFRVLALKLKETPNLRVISLVVPGDEVDGPTAAANLALAMSEGNRSRVCLVDANLRRGEVAGRFGLVEGMSLKEQLRQHLRAPDGTWDVLALGASLHLIPGDGGAQNPAALLASDALHVLMDNLRQEFDYILVTSPPVTESADAVIVQDHVDGTLLVLRAGVSKTTAVKATLGRLGQARVVGAVLTEVPRLPRA